MTKLSDLGKDYKSRPLAPVYDQSEHFYACEHCGQFVDMRDLRQVMWHEEPEHGPLEIDG
jgi:hypothetical protein